MGNRQKLDKCPVFPSESTPPLTVDQGEQSWPFEVTGVGEVTAFPPVEINDRPQKRKRGA